MGRIALWVFLASLLTLPMAMGVMVAMALRIFRTLQHARRDFLSYQRLFSERFEGLQGLHGRLVDRYERIGEELRQAGENWEEAKEALEDLFHPTLGSVISSLLPRR